MIPLQLFRDSAEKLGYVMLSSYGTLSDDPTAFDQNDRALNAMIADAQSRFAVDPSRIYLVGFSGTAHYAWNVAPQLDGSLAGIVGVGGGLPAYSKPIQMTMAMHRPIAFFGIAGIGDFNYDAVRWLDESLDTTRVHHRFVSHDGQHQWPPEEIAHEAVEWLELQAMRSGLIDVDRKYTRELRNRYMEEAKRMEKSDDPASAMRRYREIASDFAELGGAEDAADRFDRLSRDQEVIDEQYRRDEISRRVVFYKLDVRDFYLAYRKENPPIDHRDALRRLKIKELKKEAGDRDWHRSGAARRMLGSAFANMSFYEPRDYFQAKDYVRAAGVLRIAQDIFPDLPRTCYQLAQAAAQLGEIDEALEALECAAKADWLTPEALELNVLLEPLHGSDDYRRIIESI